MVTLARGPVGAPAVTVMEEVLACVSVELVPVTAQVLSVEENSAKAAVWRWPTAPGMQTHAHTHKRTHTHKTLDITYTY